MNEQRGEPADLGEPSRRHEREPANEPGGILDEHAVQTVELGLLDVHDLGRGCFDVRASCVDLLRPGLAEQPARYLEVGTSLGVVPNGQQGAGVQLI